MKDEEPKLPVLCQCRPFTAFNGAAYQVIAVVRNMIDWWAIDTHITATHPPDINCDYLWN